MMPSRSIVGITLVLLVAACAHTAAYSFFCRQPYSDPAMPNYTHYSVQPDYETPDGVLVDSSGLVVDLTRIDEMVREVEACTGQPIMRCGFVVKIAPNAVACNGLQVFPCEIPDMIPGCEKWDCPCGCTGIVQEPSIAVVTSNLAAFKHELIHLRFHATHDDPRFECQ